ncbi:hypothetical protein D3C77_533830 [compost metagenome]
MVGAGHRLGLILEGFQHQQRAEDFLLAEERAAVAVGDQRRGEEGALAQRAVRTTAGQQHFVAAVQRLGDAPRDLVARLPVDQRTHLRRRLQAMAQADLGERSAKCALHFGEATGVHQHASRGGALLAGNDGRRRRQFRRYGVDVGILEDQAAGFAAQLQGQLFHGRRGVPHDALPGGGGAGEAEHIDQR